MEFLDQKTPTPNGDHDATVMEAVSIVQDPNMGRCLVAKHHSTTSSLVFSDHTVLYSSNDEDDERVESMCLPLLARLQKPKTKPKVTLSRVKSFITALANDESGVVQSIDTARNFLLAVVLVLQQQRGEEYVCDGVTGQMLSLLQALGPVRQEECTALLSHLRSLPAHKHVLPHVSILSDELAGRLLGVMNNNQLQLELFEGSGVFPYACILQHDCRPNCSFSSSLDGSQCFLTAIRDIQPGDRLSIDYGNNFYHPVRTRQKHLNHAYDFVCLCSACTSGVDPFRAFYCPKCRTDGSEGVMRARYPKAELGVKSGVALESVYQNMDVEGEDEEDEDGEVQETPGEDVTFTCERCSHTTDTTATQALLDAEDALCQLPPETSDEVETLLQNGVFHPQHYMCFWLIDDIAMTLALDGQEVNPKSAHSRDKIRTSIKLVNNLLELMESNPGVASPHPEEVIFLDRIAQLYVMVGDVALAKRSYKAAYDKSCLCAGATNVSTLELKTLVDNTPATPAALMDHYQSRRPNS